MSKFLYELKKYIVTEEIREYFLLTHNSNLVCMSGYTKQIYKLYKNENGMLHLNLEIENTFGKKICY
jgi:hypothetical protein